MEKYTDKSIMSSSIIIGEDDGPTSIFIAGRTKPASNFFRRKFTEYRRRKILKTLIPEPHSLEEVRIYIIEKYHATEADTSRRDFQENYSSLKASLIEKNRPDLLGEPLEYYKPADIMEERSLLRYLKKSLEYTQKAKDMPESLFPMDYHLYEIVKEKEGTVTIDMDFLHNILGISYSCKKGKQKIFKSIQKDIYSYYGVSQEDIDTHSQRLQTLFAALLS